MTSLQAALESGQISGAYSKAPREAAQARVWGKRTQVKAAIDTTSGHKTLYSSKSVLQQLCNSYGDDLAHKVFKKVNSKCLSARQIAKLDHKAIRMKNSYDQTVRHAIKKWLQLQQSGSLASKLFTKICGRSPSTLSQTERKCLHDHLLSELESVTSLTKQSASTHIIKALRNYRSPLLDTVPGLSSLVSAQKGGQAPVLFDHISRAHNLSGVNDQHRPLIQNLIKLSEKTAKLQQTSPFDQLDVAPWPAQIKQAREHQNAIRALLSAFQNEGNLSEHMWGTMVADLCGQVNCLDQHIHFLQELAATDFRQQSELNKTTNRNLKTAVLLIEQAISDRTNKEKGKKTAAQGVGTSLPATAKGRALVALKEQLQHELKKPGSSTSLGLTADMSPKAQIKALKAAFKKAGAQMPTLDKKWQKTTTALINNEIWQKIDKRLVTRDSRGLKTFQSEHIPAGQMRLQRTTQGVGGTRDSFVDSYEGGGCSSASTAGGTHHVLNMYQTRLTDDGGNTLFSGLRSGVLYPHKAPVEERQKGLKNRAYELLTAALVSHISTLPAEQQEEILTGGKEVGMDFITTSLLSPDRLRHISGFHDDEMMFQKEQHSILKQLCSQKPLKLNVFDSQGIQHEVSAQINLASFNIPVNNLAFNGALAMAGQVWPEADRYTDQGLAVVLGCTHPDGEIGGMVKRWLNNEGKSSPDRTLVLQLVQQIRQLYSRQLHHTEGWHPHKLVERIQLLGFKIGAITHFGCKSGKDRTGDVDAHVKALAIETARLGQLPDPVKAPPARYRETIQTCVYGAGELEIQNQNINKPGYKTTPGRAMLGDSLFNLIH